jgi:hypothetical protein
MVIVVVAIVLRQMLSFLYVFSYWYPDDDLEGILLLRNVLRRVELWLRLRWHIP